MNKNKGFGFLGFGLFLFAVLILYFYYIEPRIKFEELKSSPPKITMIEKMLVDKYKANPTPKTLPLGAYNGEVTIGKRKVTLAYYFGTDGVLLKELNIHNKDGSDGLKMSGSSKYRFDGSTLVYSNISGDKHLFPEIGEAIDVKDQNTIVIPGDQTITLHLLSDKK